MRKSIMIAALALTAATAAYAKSDKRGVSENGFSMGSMLEALEPGVTWYYNWGNVPGAGFQNQVIDFEGIEFVPMCWNGNFSAEKIREYCKSHPQTKYLLGFNEPNFKAQANMTPKEAADKWPEVKALADELGLKLVAPVLNYSPDAPYYNPLQWMDEFVALVGLDAFDYTAVHNYGGLGVLKTLAGNFHDKYGKPVWVTEFCYWPNEGDPKSSVNPDTQIASMTETLEWLEKTDWIYRYAWFKAIGNSAATTGPNYGLLVHEGAGTDPWTLSPQGYVYTYMSDFDSDFYLQPATLYSATKYIESTSVSLGQTADGEAPVPLEIKKFNAGAQATWQFEVKDAGAHYLTLSCGGFGEPSRYDPTLQWFLVNGEQETPLTEAVTLTLPNSETTYGKQTFTVDLPAGKIKLRLKDVAPYRPSGISISTIRLDNVAGVDEIVENDSFDKATPVYNLHGVKVGTLETLSSMPKGLYILANGKKIIK